MNRLVIEISVILLQTVKYGYKANFIYGRQTMGKKHRGAYASQNGFTLIELLVVLRFWVYWQRLPSPTLPSL
jgi:hypothetical protein